MGTRWCAIVALMCGACGGSSDGTQPVAQAPDALSGGDGAGSGTAGSDAAAGGCAKEVPGARCNPYCQTGCAADQQCTFNFDEFACTSVGKKAAGDDCGASKECAKGQACFALNGGTQVCQAFCIGDADCAAGMKCNVTVSLTGGVSATICGKPGTTCDPTASTACAAGQACYMVGGGVWECRTAGTEVAGTRCIGKPAGFCAAGLQCLVDCRAVCTTKGGTDACETVCPGDYDIIDATLGVGYCWPAEPAKACELLGQTGCAAGQGCFPVLGGFGCAAAGTGEAGAACATPTDCKGGTLCVQDVCRTVCGATDAAPEALRCSTLCPDKSAGVIPEKWGLGVCGTAGAPG